MRDLYQGAGSPPFPISAPLTYTTRPFKTSNIFRHRQLPHRFDKIQSINYAAKKHSMRAVYGDQQHGGTLWIQVARAIAQREHRNHSRLDPDNIYPLLPTGRCFLGDKRTVMSLLRRWTHRQGPVQASVASDQIARAFVDYCRDISQSRKTRK